MTTRAFNLQTVPYWAAILPLVTVNICYLVAVAVDHVPACIPYLSGCTSVSSTGRGLPESLIFRAGMLPSAILLMIFWDRCSSFLVLGGQIGAGNLTLRLLGVIAGLSLILYAVTLGFDNGIYPSVRQSGIYGFAFGSFFAQALLIIRYRNMCTEATRKLWWWLVILCVSLPILGIVSELAKLAGGPRKPVNNLVAWNSFIIASAYYLLVARIWQHHGFSGELRLESPELSDNTSSGRPTSPSE